MRRATVCCSYFYVPNISVLINVTTEDWDGVATVKNLDECVFVSQCAY